MSYATPAQLRQWFIQERIDNYLPKPDTAQGTLLQEALDIASAEMDSYFQPGGYTVPVDVATNPGAATRAAMLKQLCMALALDTLRLSLDGLPENLREQVETARAKLRAIRGLQGYRPDGSTGRVAAFEDLPGLARNE